MKIYTTGEVSRICQVSMSTVNKWFDTGQLKGFRVPGSRHRRIPQTVLLQFLHKYGFPSSDFEFAELPKVFIVSPDVELGEWLASELAQAQLNIRLVRSSFDAGIEAEAFRPDCVIVDFAIGADEALRICQHARSKSDLDDPVLIAVLSSEVSRGEELALVDDVFETPFDPELLKERLRTLVSSRMNPV